MTNFSTQKERILQFIDYKGISKNKFYIHTGISNGVLDKKSGLSMDTVEKFYSTYPEINPEWLLTGLGPMLKDESKLATAPMQLGEGIPLIPIEAMAGFGNGHTAQIMEYDTEQYVIPEFSELRVEFLIRMRGSSMNPKYNSGDLLGCRRLPMDTFFQWGKVYVLDTIQGSIVKRVFKSDRPGYVTCVSDNEKYPPFEIEFDTQVNAIAIVLGVIRLE